MKGRDHFILKGYVQVGLTLLLFALSLVPWLIPVALGYLKVLSPFLLTITMYRAFALFHEGTHNSLSKNRRINDGLAVLVSPLCLLPFFPWKSSHLLHHKWSGNIEKDPVMAFVKIHPKLSNLVKDVLDLAWRMWIPVLASIQHIVFWVLAIDSAFRGGLKIKIIASVIFPLLVWTSIIILSPLSLIIGLFIPSVYIYLLGTEVINLPHHLQLDYRYDDSQLNAWDQHRTARSCVYPRWLSNYVVLNFNYHVEHHMFPDFEWFRLSEVSQAISSELGSQYFSEPSFSWILASRKLPISEVLAPRSAIKKKILAA